MNPVKIAYLYGATQAYRDFLKEAGLDLPQFQQDYDKLIDSPDLAALRAKLLKTHPEQAYEWAPHEGAPFQKEHPGVEAEVIRQLLAKQGASLGDPAYWQGGTPTAEEAAPPQATAEDAAMALAPGIFQGLQLKVNPDGQRSTTVKVTPDALQTPEAVAGIFQAEPETKVEMMMPQPTGAGAGGAGGGPNDMGLPQGMPLDGAGAMPPPGVPPKLAAFHKFGRR